MRDIFWKLLRVATMKTGPVWRRRNDPSGAVMLDIPVPKVLPPALADVLRQHELELLIKQPLTRVIIQAQQEIE